MDCVLKASWVIFAIQPPKLAITQAKLDRWIWLSGRQGAGKCPMRLRQSSRSLAHRPLSCLCKTVYLRPLNGNSLRAGTCSRRVVPYKRYDPRAGRDPAYCHSTDDCLRRTGSNHHSASKPCDRFSPMPGIDCYWCPRILTVALWEKFIFFVAVSGLGAATRQPMG